MDSGAAKRQRLDGPSSSSTGGAAACPVSLQLVDEYEAFVKKFWSSVHEHMHKGELDLGERRYTVQQHSSTNSCRHNTHALHLDMGHT